MADSETVAFYYLAFNFVAFFTALTKEIFQHNSAFPVTFNLIFRVIVTLVQRTAIDDSWPVWVTLRCNYLCLLHM